MDLIKNLPSDIEIRTIVRSPHAKEIFKAYNIQMEEEEEEPDITVPIIEMTESEDQWHMEDEESDNTSQDDHVDSSQTIKEGSHRCDICDTVFRVKHSITKHKRVVHGIHQFTCMFCHQSYPLKRNLLQHIYTHKGPNGFKCIICKKLRPNYISIQRHFKTHTNKKISCLHCNAKFKTKPELKQHEKQHKEKQIKQQQHQMKLNNHINLYKINILRCQICQKDFNSKENLLIHQKEHYEEKPFKCEYCSLSFFTNSARKKHLPIHEREKRKPFECKECKKKYTSTTSLAVHRMKFHSGGRVYHCHYCKQKFKSKKSFTEHVADHASERPHSCQHCICRYKNKRELRRHQREKEHYDVTPQILNNKKEEEEEWVIPEPEVCLNVDDYTSVNLSM